MVSNKFVTAAAAVLGASLVSAQTYTSCNPTEKTCPADAALGGSITVDFTKGENSFFTAAAGTSITYDNNLGAVFTINKDTDAPTISSTKYIFYGKVDLVARAAAGVGIVTSFVMQSDDLDEIDWEWLGGDDTEVQTNYYSKGCTTVYGRGGFSKVADPVGTFHTYTIDWTPTTLTWSIDGTVVRTLDAASATGCNGYPQTPMQIKLGMWDGGGPNQPSGTVQWAGGSTDFSKAPFNGYYKSLTITDYSNGVTGATSYVYGDKTGSSGSIEVLTGGASGNNTSASSSSAASSAGASSSTGSSSSSSKGGASSASATTLVLATSSASASSNSTGSSSTAQSTPAPSSSSTGSSSVSGSSPKGNSSSTTVPASGAGKVAFSLGSAALLGALFMVGSLL